MLSLGETFLADNRLNLRIGAAHRSYLTEIGQMARTQREAQVEELGLHVARLLLQLLDRELTETLEILLHYASSRATIFVSIGSFAAARRNASRATAGATPESSKSTRPGRTTATHNSGFPLPEPIRVSAGFFVTGLSGKTLIQTLPPRRILRVIAIRAASIWRFVSQPASSDFRPYSPNCTVTWPRERPARRPRCCLRWLTRFGESISYHLRRGLRRR